MKTTLVLLACLATVNISIAQNHKKRCTEERDCKKLEEEGTITRGKKEGYWKLYYPHLTGHRIRREGSYTNDKETGTWKMYSPHGYMYEMTTFVDGLEHGESTGYHEGGAISSKSYYVNGKLTGESRSFYSDGKLKSTFQASTNESKEFHWNGKLKTVGFVNAEGRNTGEWKEYDEKGTLISVGNYNAGQKTGIWNEYHENGALKATGEMNAWKRSGAWKFYHDNGKLSGSGMYKEDGYPKENSWTTYDRNGKMDSVNCPMPTGDQLIGLFLDIWQKTSYEGPHKFAYEYQETLWKMAAADPAEYLSSYPVQKAEVLSKIKGYQQVTRMWNKYNANFFAYGSVTNIASGKNVVKYAIASDMGIFLFEAIRKYRFDMNFIDPVDGKTALDFLQERIDYTKKSAPVDENKVRELQRYFDMLRTYGGKFAVELK